jgi:L-lactate dehydrogenase complex protein LldE
MTVALFVPCYVDQLYPRAAIACTELLETLGCRVLFPKAQTCCGQPLANAGHEDLTGGIQSHFEQTFADFEYIVAPSASCVSHVRTHYSEANRGPSAASRTYELCEFLTDVLAVDALEAAFPHRVGIHHACHGTRSLRLNRSSELVAPHFDRVSALLGLVDGIEFVELSRPDECCGFGGIFSVSSPGLSTSMGTDRVLDHVNAGADVVTSTDASCLLHLDGIIRRRRLELRVAHVAEILAGMEL